MYLDALANGLEVLGVHSLITHFPDYYLKADDVIAMLKPQPVVSLMNDCEYRLWKFNYLNTFLYEADNKGKSTVAIAIQQYII